MSEPKKLEVNEFVGMMREVPEPKVFKCRGCGKEIRNPNQGCPECEEAKKRGTKKYLSEIGIGPAYHEFTLSSYSAQTPAQEAAKGRLSTWDPSENLILFGGAGTGKTGLTVGLVRRIAFQNPSKSFKWENIVEFLCRVKSMIESNGSEYVVKEALRDDILILDDLGAEKISDFTTETIYRLLNKRIEFCRPTIVTTNLTPQELGTAYGARIVSRLCSGSVIQLDGLDRRLPKNRTRDAQGKVSFI